MFQRSSLFPHLFILTLSLISSVAYAGHAEMDAALESLPESMSVLEVRTSAAEDLEGNPITDPSELEAIGRAIGNKDTAEKIEAVYIRKPSDDVIGRTLFRFRYTDKNGAAKLIGPTYIAQGVTKTKDELKEIVQYANKSLTGIRNSNRHGNWWNYFVLTKKVYVRIFHDGYNSHKVDSSFLVSSTVLSTLLIGGPLAFVSLPLLALPAVIIASPVLADLFAAPVITLQRMFINTKNKIDRNKTGRANKKIGSAMDSVMDPQAETVRLTEEEFSLVLKQLETI